MKHWAQYFAHFQGYNTIMKSIGTRREVFQSVIMLLCFTIEAVIASSTSTPRNFSTFRVKTTPDGTPLCANDIASVVYNISQLTKPPVGTGCVPASALCASRCYMDANCSSFNWKRDEELCQLFYSTPRSCAVVPMCSHYQVITYIHLTYIIYIHTDT